MPHDYCTYGLQIRSDLPLPELERSSGGAPDVRIVLAEGAPPGDPPRKAGEEWLYWEEVGGILVSGGTTATVHLHDGVSDELARLPILGPVLGTILRQRGRVVLHASAVAVGGRVAAFVGHKGYGKSTTAGALHARGHLLVTDDVLPVEGAQDGEEPRVWPGFPRLSMWPEAVSAIGQDPAALPALHERVTKKAVPAAEGFAAQKAHVLGGIYVLGRGDGIDCRRLSPREAFVELLRHSYCSGQLGQLNAEAAPEVFGQYTRLVEVVPVWRLERPDDLTALPEIARTVEENLRASSPSSSGQSGGPPSTS